MAISDYTLDRGLPSNVEAERSLLGAILLDNTLYTEAAAALKPDDFFLDAHRRIYSRMLEMADTNRPIDLVTLSEELSRHKELEAVGGVAYLSSLTDGTPRRTSIEHYVRIVRDKSLMRGVIRAANTIMQSALDQSEHRRRCARPRRSGDFQPFGEPRPAGPGPAQPGCDGIVRRQSRQTLRARQAHHRPGDVLTAISTNLPAACNARN